MPYNWTDRNWARQVIFPVTDAMLVAASLDSNYLNYVTDANLTASGTPAYAQAKHHQGYQAVTGHKLYTTFAALNLQAGFAVGCHFRARKVFNDATLNTFHSMLTLWDGVSMTNGYMELRLDYRDGQTQGIRVITNHVGATKEIQMKGMDIADASDHSVVVTGWYDTTLDKGKMFLYLDGYLINCVKLTDAGQIQDACVRLEVGNYAVGTNYPSDCNLSDLFLLPAFIEDSGVVLRYHDEGLNLDCVNDGKVIGPGYRVYGYERKRFGAAGGIEVMDYDPDTQRIWGAGTPGATDHILYYADEDGTGMVAAATFAATDVITSVRVIGDNLFVGVRDGATPNICTLKKSDKTTISWSDVKTLEDDFYMITGWSGPVGTPSGNLFVAEYRGPVTGGNGANIYRSTDGGDNWLSSKQLDAPAGQMRHFHGIFYDPYRDRVWACWGDGVTYFGVCYTDNDGDDWTNLFTQATANLTTVFGSFQCIQGVATQHGCVWGRDAYNECGTPAFWWDAYRDHGYDGAGAAMQRWSELGPFFAPDDPNIYAVHKCAKTGTMWFLGHNESQAGRNHCIYLSHNDGRTMVLAENPAEVDSGNPAVFVETPNYIWRSRTRWGIRAQVVEA